MDVANLASLWLLTALSGWRLAYALTSESGPYDAFARLRDWAGIRYDEHSQPYVVAGPRAVLGGALSCLRCCSVWTCGLCLGFALIHPLLVVPLAASTLAIVMHEVVEWLEQAGPPSFH